jgi:uncharacterized protein YjiS (DUF1127 family)
MPTPVASHRLRRAPSRQFSTIFGRIGEWMRHRRETRLLQELTDAQLKDIGLSRAEIESVVRTSRAFGWPG